MRNLTKEIMEALDDKGFKYDLKEGTEMDEEGTLEEDSILIDFIGEFENSYRLFIDVYDNLCDFYATFFTEIKEENAKIDKN